MEYKVIDFHTHPFDKDDSNFCNHKKYCNMSPENTERDLRALGVEYICGSLISKNKPEPITFDFIKEENDRAFNLADFYKGFYIPGIHIHPQFIKESILEVERANKKGVKLVGELVPYLQRWQAYPFSSKELEPILEAIDHYKMVVSIHTSEEMLCDIDYIAKRYPNTTFVGAHICDGTQLEGHIKLLKENDNYYVDLSGGGIYRHGVLRHVIDECGDNRILFGSDYPICNIAMYINGVSKDFLITEEEKQKVLYDNAKKLLGI